MDKVPSGGLISPTMFPPNILSKSISLVLCAALAGCASIVSSGDQNIKVGSAPDHAEVTITGANGEVAFTGTTPSVAKLRRGAGYFKGATYKVRIAKTGYAAFETRIESKVNGWYFGNFFIGGLLGLLIVDPATGGMWTLDPEAINADLRGRHAELFPTGDGIHVVLRKNVPSVLASHLRPIPRKS